LSSDYPLTCLEGDAIDFDSFLRNVPPCPDEPDREQCRLAFEEERATPSSPSRQRSGASADAGLAATAADAPPPPCRSRRRTRTHREAWLLLGLLTRRRTGRPDFRYFLFAPLSETSDKVMNRVQLQW
jgi:hypothetical protein